MIVRPGRARRIARGVFACAVAFAATVSSMPVASAVNVAPASTAGVTVSIPAGVTPGVAFTGTATVTVDSGRTVGKVRVASACGNPTPTVTPTATGATVTFRLVCPPNQAKTTQLAVTAIDSAKTTLVGTANVTVSGTQMTPTLTGTLGGRAVTAPTCDVAQLFTVRMTDSNGNGVFGVAPVLRVTKDGRTTLLNMKTTTIDGYSSVRITPRAGSTIQATSPILGVWRAGAGEIQAVDVASPCSIGVHIDPLTTTTPLKGASVRVRGNVTASGATASGTPVTVPVSGATVSLVGPTARLINGVLTVGKTKSLGSTASQADGTWSVLTPPINEGTQIVAQVGPVTGLVPGSATLDAGRVNPTPATTTIDATLTTPAQARVVFGRMSVSATVTISQGLTTTPAVKRALRLQFTPTGSTESITLATGTTNDKGQATIPFVAPSSGVITLAAGATANALPSRATPIRFTVAGLVSMRLTKATTGVNTAIQAVPQLVPTKSRTGSTFLQYAPADSNGAGPWRAWADNLSNGPADLTTQLPVGNWLVRTGHTGDGFADAAYSAPVPLSVTAGDTLAPLTAPVAVTAKPGLDGAGARIVTVAWQHNSGAATYRIETCDGACSSGDTFTEAGTTEAGTRAFVLPSPPAAGAKVTYRVVAVDQAQTQTSDPVVVVTPPLVPTNAALTTVTDTSATITFTAPAGADSATAIVTDPATSTAAQPFGAVVTSATVSAVTIDGASSSLTVTGLAPGSLSLIRVQATATNGTDTAASDATEPLVVISTLSPATPTAVAGGTGEVDVTWEGIDGAPLLGWRVLTCDTDGCTPVTPASSITPATADNPLAAGFGQVLPPATRSAKVSGLLPGRGNRVAVQAVTAATVGSSATVEVQLPLPTPGSPKVDSVNSTSANLSWDPVPGAVTYVAYACPTDSAAACLDGSATGSVPVISSPLTLTGLSSGTDYKVTLQAFGAAGLLLSPVSAATDFTTAPAAPTLVGTVTGTSVSITATLPYGATAVELYRCGGATCVPAVAGTPVTSSARGEGADVALTDTVAAGSIVRYVAASTIVRGSQTLRSSASNMVALIPAPSAVTGIALGDGKPGVTVSFTKPATATGVRIYRCDSAVDSPCTPDVTGTPMIDITGTATQWRDPGLGRFRYGFIAYNEAGDSEPAYSAMYATPLAQTPVILASSSATGITVTGDATRSVQIQRCPGLCSSSTGDWTLMDNGDPDMIVPPAGTIVDDVPLGGVVSYRGRLVSKLVDGLMSGPWGSAVTVTRGLAVPALTATSTSPTTVTISTPYMHDVTEYRVYIKAGSSAPSTTGTPALLIPAPATDTGPITGTLTGLIAGQRYSVILVVAVVDNTGVTLTYRNSALVGATTLIVPPIATVKSATATGVTFEIAASPGAPRLEMNWCAGANCTVPTTGWKLAAVGTTTVSASSTASGAAPLQDATPITFATRAVGAAATSTIATVTGATKPAAPTVTASAVGTDVTLAWPARARTTGYAVYANGVDITTSATVTSTGATLTNSTFGVPVSYTVVGRGPGPDSDPSVAQVVTPLAAPGFADVSSNSTTATFFTDTVTGATSYQANWCTGDSCTVDPARWTTVPAGTLVLATTRPGADAPPLSFGQALHVEVRALGSNSRSTISASDILVGASILPAPALTDASATGSTVTLTWDAVPSASTYSVQADGVKVTTGVTITGTTATITGVTTGSPTAWTVKALATKRESDPSNAITVTALAAPALTTASATGSTVTLAWAAVPGAASYDVLVNGTVTTSGVTVAGTTATITGATFAAAADYQVSASNARATAVSTATTITPVDTPANLTASATGTTVTLTWDAVDGATGYQVYADGVAATTGVTVTGTTAAITGAPAGVAVAYTVAATTTNATSLPTAGMSVTALAAPSGFTASATGTTVSLSWGPVTGATSYDVYADGIAVSTGVTATTATLTSVATGVAAAYIVVARNTLASSLPSASISVTPLDAPANVAGAATGTTVTLTWDGVVGATGYDVYADGIKSGTVTGATWTGTAAAGVAVAYTVKATNDVAVSDASAPASVTAVAAPVISGTATGATVTLTWAAVTGATAFDVYADGSKLVTGVATTATGATISDVATGVAASYTVRARNAAAVSVASNAVSITPLSAPGLSVTATTTSAVTVALTAVTGATGYEINWCATTGCTPDAGTWKATPAGTVVINAVSPAAGAAALTQGAPVTVRARAINTLATSALATASSVTVITAPTLTGTATGDTVNLSWTANSAASGYNVYAGGTLVTSGITITGTTATLTGVTTGTAIAYTVTAYSASAESAPSAAVTITALAAPATLTGSATGTTVSLSWAAVPGATAYDILAGGVKTTTGVSISGTTATITSAATGSTINYSVRGTNTLATGAAATVLPVTPVAAPTLSLGSATTGSVTATVGTVTGATGYELNWCTGSGCTPDAANWTTATAGTNVISTVSPAAGAASLAEGTIVVVRTRAVASNATSTATSSSATTTMTAPTLTATGVGTTASLSWTANSAATGYKVYVNGTYNASATATVSGTTATVSSLAAGTTYAITVTAFNAAIESPQSTAVSVTALAAPTGLTGSATGTGVSLSWNAVTGATSYDVYAAGSKLTSGVTVTGTTAAVASPPTGAAIAYTVRATATNSSSNASNTMSITPLAAPTGLTGSATGTTVSLAWTGTAGATSYEVLAGGVKLTSGVTFSGLSATVTSVATGSAITYTVRGVNTTATGPQSTGLAITPVAAPSLSATAAGGGSVNAVVGAVTGATDYEINWCTGSGCTPDAANWTSVSDGTTAITTVSPAAGAATLTDGTVVVIQARAKSATAVSSSSSASTTTTLVAPTLTATATGTTATLTWNATAGATGYKVYINGTYNAAATTSISGTSTTATGLAAGTTYAFTVTATNAAIESAASNAVSVTAVAAPTGLTASAAGSTVSLSWNAVTAATGYDVFAGGVKVTSGITFPTATTATITGAPTGSAMSYTIRSTAANSTSNASTAASLTPLATPAGLTGSATATTVSLAWTSVPGATGYQVLAGGTQVTTNITIDTANATATLTSVAVGSAISYTVRATATNSTSTASSAFSITPVAAPTLSAAATSGSAVTATVGTVTGATGYELNWCTGTGCTPDAANWTTAVAGANVINAVSPAAGAATLTDGTVVVIHARAKSAAATSTVASTSTVTSLAAPTLAATAAGTTATLTWNTVAGATGYKVYINGTYNAAATTSISGTTATASSLTAGTTYALTVTATNAAIESPVSNAVSVTALATPTTPTGSAAGSTVSLSWGSVTAATGYDVFADGVKVTSGITFPTATTATITGAPTGSAISYTVKAAAANSASTTTSGFSVTPLTTPAGLTGSASATTVSLSWTSVPGATGYQVLAGGTQVTSNITIDTANATATLTSVATGSAISYTVRATATNSTSTASSTFSITPVAAPTLSLGAVTTGSVTATVGTVTGATGYEINWCTGSGCTPDAANWTTAVAGANVISTVSPAAGAAALGEGTVIVVQARATSAAATSTTTSATSTTTMTAPTLTASVTGTTASLSWGANSAATGYKVYVNGTYNASATISGTTATLTGLTAGTTYSLTVTAFNAAIESPQSSAVTVTALAAPTGLTGTAAGTTVSLTWAATTGATGYEVYADGTLLTTTAAASATLTSVPTGTAVSYTVKATAARSASPASAAVSVTPLAAPAGLTGSADGTTVSLSWTAVTGATGYEVYAGAAKVTTGITISGASATLTSVTTGSAISYTVRAINAAASSNASTAASVTPLAAPAGLTGSADGTTVSLSWTAVTGATGYRVFAGGTDVTASATITGAAATISGTPGTSTTYSIKATNASALSASSSTVSVTPLASPATLTGSATGTTVSLSWASVTGATGYQVFAGGTQVTANITISGTGATLTSVATGSAITYTVKAAASGAVSAASPGTTVTPVAAPTGLTGSADGTTVSLSWTATAGATGYEVYLAGTKLTSNVTVTGTTATVTNVATGASLSYTVRAITAASTSTASSAVAITPVAAPALAGTDAGASSVTVSLSATAGATSYQVNWCTGVGCTPAPANWTATATGSIVIATQSPAAGAAALVDGDKVTVVARAFGPNSTSATSTVTTGTGLIAPTITGTTDGSTVTLSWAGNGSAIGFRVYANGTEVTSNIAVTGTGATLTSVATGSPIAYTVQAYSANSSSSDSNTLTLTPLATPTGLTGAATGTTVSLTWAAVTGATGYDVYAGAVKVTGNITVTGTSATLTSVATGSAVSYTVKATASGSASAASTAVSITPVAAPSITASADGATVTLAWTPITGATSYQVFAGGTQVTSNITVGASGATLTSVAAGSAISYTVRAVNANASATSAAASVTPLATPSATGSATGTTVTLNWAAVPGATGYQVWANLSTQVTSNITISGTTATLTSVAAGTATSYTVVATNAAAISDDSLPVTITPVAAPVVTGSASATTVTLSWTTVTGASTYEVYADGTRVTTGITVSPTGATLIGVGTGSAIAYTVKAVNANAGSTSNAFTLTPLAAPVVTGSADATTITLSWPSVSGATGYSVYAGGTLVTAGITVTGTGATITSATLGTAVTYTAVATNTHAASAASTGVSITPLTAPTAPTASASGSTVSLAWAAVTGATGYQVFAGGTQVTSGITFNAASATITGAATGSAISYTVKATNTRATSAASAAAAVTPLATPAVTGSATDTNVTLSWASIAGASGYEVYANGTKVTANIAVSSTGATLTSVATGSPINYTVVATATASTSAQSTAVTITPVAAPGVTVASTTDTSVTISIPAASGATSYKVNWCTTWTCTPDPANWTAVPTGSYTISKVSPATGAASLVTATEVHVQVLAYGANSTSAAAVQKTGTGLLKPSVTASVDGTTLTLSWPASSFADAYEISNDGVVAADGTANAPIAATFTTTGVYTTGAAITGLTAGTASTYYVHAQISATGSNSVSNPVTVTPLAAPASPSGSVTGTTVSLSWSAVTGATGYEVYADGAKVTSNLTFPTATTATITNAPTGTAIAYTIKAINASAVSAASTAVTRTPLAAPTGLTGSATGTTVSLSWTAVTGATGYTVQANGVTVASGITFPTATTATITGVATGSAITYTVLATATSSTSAASTAVSITPVAAPSAAPTGSATGTTVSLAWNAVTGATGYDVYAGGVKVTSGVTVTGTTATITGVATGSAISYTIRALGTNSTSAASSSLSITPVAAPAATGNATGTTVSLTWAAITGATSYQVFADGVQVTANITISGTTATLTSVATGATISYTVRALANNATSAFSTAVPIAPVAAPDAAPTGSATGTTVSLAWNAVTGATGYDVYAGGVKVTSGVTVTGTTATITGVATGSAISYTIRALGTNSTSAASSSLSITPVAAPAATVSNTSDTSIILSLPAVTGAAGYQVNWCAGWTCTVDPTLWTTTSTGTVTISSESPAIGAAALVTNTKMTVQFRALGTNSTSAAATVKSGTGLIPPSVTATADGTTVTLAWANNSFATSYQVYAGGVQVTSGITTTGTGATLTSVATGTPISYTVVAVGASSSSDPSAPVSVTPLAAPTGLTGSADGSTVSLSWNAVTGATGYDVYAGGTKVTTGITISGAAATLTGVASGATISYTVKATNARASSAASAATSITPLAAIADLAGTISGTTVTLTWTAVTNATGYVVFADGADITASATLTGTTTRSAVLTAPGGTAVVYTVEPINAAAMGEPSNSVTVTALATPASLAGTATGTTVTLDWTPVTGATSYLVYAGGTQVTANITIDSSNGAATLTSVGTGSAISYTVRAANAAGQSLTSAATSVTPLAATTLSGSSDTSAVSLSWTAVTGATGYDVYANGALKTTGITFPTATSATITGMAADVSVNYTVVATNASAASATSNTQALFVLRAMTVSYNGGATTLSFAYGSNATAFQPTTTGAYGTTTYAYSGATLPVGMAFSTTNGTVTGPATSGWRLKFTQVSVGKDHACGVTTTGAAYCWGSNGSKQLGDGGATTTSRVPVQVSGLTSGVAKVVAGDQYSCALLTTGTAKCWGTQGSTTPRLGNGGSKTQSTPVNVSTISGLTGIAAGGASDHTCAFKSTGAWCWGIGSSGQLGNGGTSRQNAPVAVSNITTGLTHMAVGLSHTCAVVSGAARCWGLNGNGQLGDTTVANKNVPTAVTGLTSGVTEVAVGDAYSCARMTADGSLRCWGSHNVGQLGDGSTINTTNRTSPVTVSSLTGAKGISAGRDTTCAITSTDTVVCWGNAAAGALGNNTTTPNRNTPGATTGPADVTSLAVGGNATSSGTACAVTTGNGLMCWGFNASGQVGDNTTTSRSVGTAVSNVGSNGFPVTITVTATDTRRSVQTSITLAQS